jgi:SAM-dependent methyltransferase
VESSTGLRGVLANPSVYELFQRLVGAHRSRATLVREYVRPEPRARVLDVGCGPGELVRYLGEAEYVGVDASEAYVEEARRRFGDRAAFRVGDATRLDVDLRGFDLVLGFGLVHHLDDEEACAFWAGASRALAPGGRVVAVDPTLVERQPRLARMVICADRGDLIRSPAEYVRLAETAFGTVRSTVRSGLLRIPYTHCVIEANA